MVAIFIGFSRKRGGSPRRQRPGDLTLRLGAGVRSVESNAVSSDITVDEARAAVSRSVRAQVAPEPGFRGAFLTGSATDLSGTATLPRSSDVDVTVLVGAAAERQAGGRRRARRRELPRGTGVGRPGVWRALVADLTGLRTPADVLTRRDALLADLAAPPPAGRSLRTPGAA
jgi:hypothetical protein